MIAYGLQPVGLRLPIANAAEDVSKEIIAIQIRKQGYRCNKAVSADRDTEHGKKKGGWILRCDDATYHIHLIPRRPAEVELVK
jgi:hypothetical protein